MICVSASFKDMSYRHLGHKNVFQFYKILLKRYDIAHNMSITYTYICIKNTSHSFCINLNICLKAPHKGLLLWKTWPIPPKLNLCNSRIQLTMYALYLYSYCTKIHQIAFVFDVIQCHVLGIQHIVNLSIGCLWYLNMELLIRVERCILTWYEYVQIIYVE